MGADLHRPQPHQARPLRLSGLSFVKQPNPSAIWTVLLRAGEGNCVYRGDYRSRLRFRHTSPDFRLVYGGPARRSRRRDAHGADHGRTRYRRRGLFIHPTCCCRRPPAARSCTSAHSSPPAIAERMAARDLNAASAYPEVLAEHFADAGGSDRAADYWSLAGHKERRRPGPRSTQCGSSGKGGWMPRSSCPSLTIAAAGGGSLRAGAR